MGILNVTPDSFSDGGRFFNFSAATKQAEEMLSHGVDILDIGGESTRPGSEGVPVEEELRRVIPLVETIKKRYDVLISIDTVKGKVANHAIEAGADIVNDISGFRMDSELLPIIVQKKVPVVVTHMKGVPRTMQANPVYEDVVQEVVFFLQETIQKAIMAGVEKDQIIVDPGIGFGKTKEHNWELIGKLNRLNELGSPVLMAASRKAFLRQLVKEINCLEELFPMAPEVELASHAVAVSSVLKGAHIVRTHDVVGTKIAVAVADKILDQGE